MKESTELHLAFPLYVCEFLPDEKIVVGGGGGITKSGLSNGIILLELKTTPKLCIEKLDQHDFPEGYDSCSSLAIHPKGDYIVCGVNHNQESKKFKTCRIYTVKNEKIIPGKSYCTLDTLKSDNYQTAISFSNSNRFAIASSCGKVQLWSWPCFSKLEYSYECRNHSIDLDINDEFVACTLNGKCNITDLNTNKIHWIISKMELPRVKLSYSSKARFGRFTTKDYLFMTLCSPTSRRDAIVKFNFKDRTTIKRKALKSTVVYLVVSPNGAYIGVAFTDTSIMVLSTDNLCTLLHTRADSQFVITSLSFSHNGPFLASCSVAGLLKVYRFTPMEEKASSALLITVSITLISIAISAIILETNRQTIINLISDYAS